mmetsp:Transcript_27804/g.30897  ORF Transcript_27804/g.30897 Transcript_27804/m.30897 type:complete len:395 (-) Transcript_27804:57-1241(-)
MYAQQPRMQAPIYNQVSHVSHGFAPAPQYYTGYVQQPHGFVNPFESPVPQQQFYYAVPAPVYTHQMQHIPVSPVESTTTVVESESPRLKKCRHCSCYYNDSEKDEGCTYHPGQFRGVYKSRFSAGSLIAWSCCKNTSKDAPGCKRLRCHKEDRRTSTAMARVDLLMTKYNKPEVTVEIAEPSNGVCPNNFTAPGLSDREIEMKPLVDFSEFGERPGPLYTHKDDKLYPQLDTKETEDTKLTEEVVAAPVGPKLTKKMPKVSKTQVVGEGVIMHGVELSDTLSGLALSYNVTKASIKRLNPHIYGDSIQGHAYLKIPYTGPLTDVEETEEDVKKRQSAAVVQFRRQGRCGANEALYYMSSNGYDIAKALKDKQEDEKWAKDHGHKHDKSTWSVKH